MQLGLWNTSVDNSEMRRKEDLSRLTRRLERASWWRDDETKSRGNRCKQVLRGSGWDAMRSGTRATVGQEKGATSALKQMAWRKGRVEMKLRPQVEWQKAERSRLFSKASHLLRVRRESMLGQRAWRRRLLCKLRYSMFFVLERSMKTDSLETTR